MKYYKIENGEFVGFYDSEIHGNLTDGEGCYEISDEKWMELLETDGEINYIDNELKSVVRERTKEELMIQLAELKYNKQESLYITETTVDNITASYNYLMLKEAIETYEEGISIKWKNIDGTRHQVDDSILEELKKLRIKTKEHYQKCFDTQEIIEEDINNLSNEEIQNYDLEKKWIEMYEGV